MDDGNNKEIADQDQIPVNEDAMELSAAFCHAISESDDTGCVAGESPVAADNTDNTGFVSASDGDITPNDAAMDVVHNDESGDESADEKAVEVDLFGDNDSGNKPVEVDIFGDDDSDNKPVEVNLFGDVIEDDDDEPDDNDIPEQEITTCSVVEAILFAADEPVNIRKIVEIINAGGVKEVKKHIRELNRRYKKMGCAFRVEELAGGYQLLTQSAYNPWLSKLIKVRSEGKLSAAAMETLAIIAYKQPLMRVEIENIRGVAAGEMIRQLIEKGLVKITGRAEELGRPLLYGTTQKFLDIFGLASLKDLPQPEAAARGK